MTTVWVLIVFNLHTGLTVPFPSGSTMADYSYATAAQCAIARDNADARMDALDPFRKRPFAAMCTKLTQRN